MAISRRKGHDHAAVIRTIDGARMRWRSLRRFLGASLVMGGCIMLRVQLKLLSGFVPTQGMGNIAVVPDLKHWHVSSSSDVDTPTLLPSWISDYLAWHKEMRASYPGSELFTNPKAPKLIIRLCLQRCGGINDRLGQLPWDLYLANQTKRVFLIQWVKKPALEHFLLPNMIDWSIPSNASFWLDTRRDFFEGMGSHTTDEFISGRVDAAVMRATFGEFSNKRFLYHNMLGHMRQDGLETRLLELGETDMIHNTPTFGRIFHAFFQPSPELRNALDMASSEMHLTPGEYTAVHLRVRHPRGAGAIEGADKTGLVPFEGENKRFAVNIANHAVKCARTLSFGEEEPIYFYSDSSDLVQYMVHELENTTRSIQNYSLDENALDSSALEAIGSAHLVARDVSQGNLHIDRQEGDSATFYGSFVDLYLAIGARCLTYGLGYFTVLASRISGVKCKLLHRQEAWGAFENKTDHAPMCTEATYSNLTY